MTHPRWIAAAAAAAMIAAPFASASEEHADILVGAQNGKLVTLAEDPAENFFLSQVYEGEMPAASYFTDDPGFNNDESDDFPAGIATLTPDTALNFNIKAVAPIGGGTAANLFFWDGSGAAAFTPVSDGTTLTVSKATGPTSSLTAVADGSANDVSGFTMDTTSSTGKLHKHIDFFMLDSIGGIDSIADGLYVLPLELTQSELDNSDPFFIVFATDGIDESVHEAGVDWVAANLVPEPTSLALLGLGGLALIARRRRGVGGLTSAAS